MPLESVRSYVIVWDRGWIDRAAYNQARGPHFAAGVAIIFQQIRHGFIGHAFDYFLEPLQKLWTVVLVQPHNGVVRLPRIGVSFIGKIYYTAADRPRRVNRADYQHGRRPTGLDSKPHRRLNRSLF